MTYQWPCASYKLAIHESCSPILSDLDRWLHSEVVTELWCECDRMESKLLMNCSTGYLVGLCDIMIINPEHCAVSIVCMCVCSSHT